MKFAWQNIDTVLLDLDGTLIDLWLDHNFWVNIVPQAYSDKFGISLDASRQKLKQYYDNISFSMAWYCIDHWTDYLDLPLRDMFAAHGKNTEVRSDVYPFLTRLNAMKKNVILLTDSHPFSLDIKLKNSNLAPHFSHCLSSHDFNAPKVEQQLWHNLQQHLQFDPMRTLFIDDTEKVLDSAAQFGIAYTVGIENPDSHGQLRQFSRHSSIHDYQQLF